MTHYKAATKLATVQLYEEERLSYAQIVAELGLRKTDRIGVWVRQYRQEGETGLSKKGSVRPCKARTDQERIAQLEMENVLLKKYHTELRKILLARRDIGSTNTTEEAIL